MWKAMYVYLHTHIHTYTHAYMHTYIPTHTHTHIHIHIHTYISISPLQLLDVRPSSVDDNGRMLARNGAGEMKIAVRE